VNTWTIEDAAALLDPPMTADEVRALIHAARIRPVGQRRTGRRGRPADTYNPADLMRAHAGIAPLLAEAEGHTRNPTCGQARLREKSTAE